MSEHGPAKRPCSSCPYRRDVPSGVWSAEEYDKLPGYDGLIHTQPPSAFFCHLNNGHLCAGWVGCHDMEESLGLRRASHVGLLNREDLDAARDYESPVALWESGQAAADHGKANIENPGLQARRTIDKLRRRQPKMKED